ncbi:unnamed protein product [Calypogeia fissa]
MASSQSYAALFVALLASCILWTSGEFPSGLESVLNKPVIEWDYSDGPNGPAHWGKLSPEWSECSSGTAQNPVNVDEEHLQQDNHVDVPAKVYYHPAHATIRADGRTLEADWAGGIFNVHEYDYILEKLVFHTPSEHTFYGERFSLEVQFYHTHPEQGVAINSLFFKEGEQNEWLNQFTAGFSEDNLGKVISLGMVTSDGVEAKDLDWRRYYHTLGSLSTPPCTQAPYVVWSLLQDPLTASKEQISKVSAALLHKPNVRPLQDMTNRIVYAPTPIAEAN